MKSFSNGLLLVIVVFSFTILGCKKSSNNPGNNNQTTFAVTLSNNATLGSYLVDKDGYTLYFFSDDYKGINTCPGGCAAIWPYFYAGSLTQENLGNGLDIADFDTINVNGVTQTRYKGWPLYYYAPAQGGAYGGVTNVREAPGAVGGEAFGNVWFVAKPDYTVMLANGQLTGNNGVNFLATDLPGDGKSLYFTNPKGLTLYTFAHDSAGINKFTHADLGNNSVWPMFETAVGSNIVVPSILDKTLFSTISVFGHIQLTYKGWPLYFFGGDGLVMGNNKGVSYPKPGIWFVPTMSTAPAPHM